MSAGTAQTEGATAVPAQTTVTLDDRLTAARREAGDLRDQLAAADSKLSQALEDRRYGDAEGLRDAADALRQPLYIAEATVTALEAAVKQLADHEAEQQRATQERDRRDQALGMYERAREQEAEALEDLDRALAEVPAAYRALVLTMQAAIQAERAVGQARYDGHSTGTVAGLLPEGMPRPVPPNKASAKFDANPLLVQILKNPNLTI
jgi:chromosome segregation ATPase